MRRQKDLHSNHHEHITMAVGQPAEGRP